MISTTMRVREIHTDEITTVSATVALDPTILIRLVHTKLDALYPLWSLLNRGFHTRLPFYAIMTPDLALKQVNYIDVSRVIDDELVVSTTMQRVLKYKYIPRSGITKGVLNEFVRYLIPEISTNKNDVIVVGIPVDSLIRYYPFLKDIDIIFFGLQRIRQKWHLCILDGFKVDQEWPPTFPILSNETIQNKLKMFTLY